MESEEPEEDLMMKCSNTECGRVGTWKFCQECGYKMIDEQKSETMVICDGKLDNGAVCGAELTMKKKFCTECGKPIDKSLFDVQIEKCQCGAPLEPNVLFCGQCGLKKNKSAATHGSETELMSKEDSEVTKTNVMPNIVEKLTGLDRNSSEASDTSAVKSDHEDESKQITSDNITKESHQSKISDPVLDNDVEMLEPAENTTERNMTQKGNINIVYQDTQQAASQNQNEVHSNVVQIGKLKIIDDAVQNNVAGGDTLAESRSGNGAHSGDTAFESNSGNSVKRIVEQKGGEEKKRKIEQETCDQENNQTNVNKGEHGLPDNGSKLDDKCKTTEQMLDTSECTMKSLSHDDSKNAAKAADAKAEMVFGGGVPHTPKTYLTNTKEHEFSSSSLFELSSKDLKSDTQAKDMDPVMPPEPDDSNSTVEKTERKDHARNTDEARHQMQTRSMTNTDKEAKDDVNKQAKKENSSSRGSGKQSTNRNDNDKKVLVRFHILTSEDYQFDPVKFDCIVVIGAEELGGWNRKSRVMRVYRHLEKHVHELTYEEHIPTRLISGGKSIPYRYLFIKKNKEEVVEHYMKNHKFDDTHRDLTVPIRLKGLDVWHQYDCYAEYKPKTITEKVWDYMKGKKKQLIEHAGSALHLFCPNIVEKGESHVNPDSILKHLKMLRECMRKIYFVDGKCWTSPEEFNKFFGGKIVKAMIHQWHMEADCSSSLPEKRDQVTAAALTILVFIHTAELPMPDLKSIHILTKALLVRADGEKRECPDFNIADVCFPEKREQLNNAIVALVKYILQNFRNPCWLFLMPWVHFLSGVCAPFEEPNTDLKHDGSTPRWWGLDKVSDAHGKFKQKSGKWEIPIENMLKHLQPLFGLDYLLPRAFISSTDLQNLGSLIETSEIPTEAVLANLTFQLKTNKPTAWTEMYQTYDEKLVESCIVMLLKQLQGAFFSETSNLKQWKMCYLISFDLLKQSLDNGRVDTIIYCTQILIHCIAMYDIVLCHYDTNKKEKHHVTLLHQSSKSVVYWVERWYSRWDLYLDYNLSLWSNMFAAEQLQSEDIRNLWNKEVSTSFMSNLQRHVLTVSYRMTQFVQNYCQKVDTYNPGMQECMSRAAEKAIEKGHDIDYRTFSDTDSKRYGSLLSQLFDTEWNKSIGASTDGIEQKILRLVLRWAAFPLYLKIYYNDSKKITMLYANCLEGLVQAVSVIEGSLEALLNGTISVGNFNLIMERDEKFPELVELISKKHSKKFIKNVLQVRQKEMKEFQLQAEKMAHLASLCQHLKNVDRSPIDDTLKKQKHLENCRITEFCQPADVSKVEKVENFRPTLKAFNVSASVFEMVSELTKYSKSSTFLWLWTGMCQKSGVETLDCVVEEVWLPVKKKLKDICDKITTGRIKFSEFEHVLAHRYKEQYDEMEREMNILGIKLSTIHERVDQLQKYRHLEACVNGAKVILDFACQYDLKGDFEQIKAIATHGNNAMEMRSFDVSVMRACDFLKEFTPKKGQCLHTFVRCGKLVEWLKDSMEKGGLKELKVFVDLAFLSAGDEPINIARVQCLHSAVTGYAPLIFDLKPDCGYEDLLNHCSIVWKELEANPNLPQMLEDTNNQLEWMKGIKKAHGSVEVTSLMQAEAINALGIYTVGKNAWKRRSQNQNHDASLLVLTDILELSVKEQSDKQTETGKQHFRSYTFSQLQDLQSRLMLVAGKAEKGSDSVDRFTMIFDSLTRLSNVYLKLCSSGCVLFKDWTARFFCDPNPKRPVCVNLAFGLGDDVPQMRGRKSTEEDLKDMVPEIANFMEKCLDEWLKYIKKKRKDYLHLNYFTVDQLVILQRELVKVGTEQEPSHLIYPLLSAVKQDCTPDDLIQAMSEAKDKIDSQCVMDIEENNVETIETEENEDDNAEDEQRMKFIQEVIEAGYDEHLAIEASNHVDIEDITQGIVWCMEHEDMDIPVEDADNDVMDYEVPVKKSIFSGWSHSETNIQTLIAENITGLEKHSNTGVEPLINDLTVLWRQFLESISSNICDYLSLEHLGLILRYLSMKDTRELNRTLPPVFKEGEPNLIVCPSADVLMTTLSIYVHNQDQPLPQSDELLMCTPNTTKDEVDIFWRRAIFDSSRKIHCLVNADLLDYDVSEAAERCLEEYLLDVYHKELSYRLLVICSSDNEYRSTIISSLDKYKRQLLPTRIDHLRQYLVNKLQVQNAQTKIKPAAFVDSDRSTVRVIKSWRAGVGKSLFKTRREDDLSGLNRSVKSDTVSIPLQEKNLNVHYVIERLLEHSTRPGELATRLFHIDVSHEVQNGIDYLLFNLLILGCLMDKTGWVWRKSSMDMYLIETMPLMMQASNRQDGELQYVHPMLNILPDVTCRSPVESLNIYMNEKPEGYKNSDQLFDGKLFKSAVFQRPFQYLLRLDQGRQLTDINPHIPEGDPQNCLQTLLRRCGLNDPSWSELHHFVWFLNTQLVDFERNNFVGAAAAEDLPGFAKFVLRFLIQMSRDFSTRSLDMSEESPGAGKMVAHLRNVDRMETDEEDEEVDDLQAYQMRRTWESSPHPYLFFNSDRFTFTFLGFNIERSSGNLIDQQTRATLERGIMAQNLYDALVRNHAPLQENFDALPRHEKIQKLCNVMGIDMPHDPDDTYELTTDNVKKILAIYMRFRCDIPVIIMGETGCGKTRLIKFMCALQVPPGLEATNMILMKVHGGTTHADIVRKVQEAEVIATRNKQELGEHMYTVLFFDEANTTEAIGLIKEIMCDKRMGGKKLKLCENLKMVAACNPYRKHSDELIKKLEQAGLGYHVDADETTDRLGRVPMRRLVYRVQPLPQSLLPLVWDFGQLNTQVEDLYIRQMVRRYIREDMLPNINGLIEVVSAILTASQDYMRAQKDECSFVSLRDVDRVLTVMSWFYVQNEDNGTLFKLMDEKLYIDEDVIGNDEYLSENEEDDDEDESGIVKNRAVDEITRSLILAIGVCYHACLKTRPKYRQHIARYFCAPCNLPGGDEQIRMEIESCQEVFLDHVQLDKNIARNMALKENVFMMVVCIELRIPLFLVGKPGSSKSLAKTIVSDAMQGNAARKELFKELKQAQMVSFQCSPLSTPDGIVGTFKQCAQFQKDKDLDTFVSIVVLDEVGLAEDSPRMPLKTLHPLLEDGCQGDEKPEKHKKVAFIGISNWALDPAKMNRGILVQREVPDLEELKNSAVGICQTEDDVSNWITPLIEPMAVSYLEIFQRASKEMREFYGLRDFYSLVKMVYSFVEKSKTNLTWHEMLHAIKRNFGGLDQVNPVESFKKNLSTVIHIEDRPSDSDPDCSPAGLIQACLFDTNQMKSESRYLLLLTENYGALSIIQQEILSKSSDIRPITIFGSSFRSDQEYTQVCRNINKIKVCMETGNTVVLLNLENLYESLYDALNQYYVYFGGERYVDLGLGTHRVKCPVHKKFRLIVVAEKQTVYDKFPIPLINRLEKHFLTINTMLSEDQQEVVVQLEEWAKCFVSQRMTGFRQKQTSQNKVGDVFIGYHDDTCSAIVLHVWKKYSDVTDLIEKHALILQEVKSVLLWCATPDSLVRLEHGSLTTEEIKWLDRVYHEEQAHESLIHYLNMKIVKEKSQQALFAQVTTHSKLIAAVHKGEVSKATNINRDKIMLLETLSSFDTEQQFTNRIVQHIKSTDKDPSLMIIQCDSGDVNANLIASARYCVLDEFEKSRDELRAPIHVVFIVQLPRGAAFTGFQCGVWHSVHIDDLYTEDMNMPTLKDMQGKSVAGLISCAVNEPEPMEVEDIHTHGASTAEPMETEDGMSFQHEATSGINTSETNMEYADRMAGEPLKLDDVLLDLRSVDKTSDLSSMRYRKNKLNIKGLILNCVQAALSMVKDKVENTNKETDRVSMVLTFLHQEHEGDQASFLHGVCSLIAKLLKEKESKSHLAHHWLVNEAASNENINKAGTFRRSCLLTLENKIAPILAGIIACLDTNDNLQILQDTHAVWKRELWLRFLNAQNAIDLQYGDLQSPTRQSELKEVVVMTTGCEGHSFTACFPFSWFVILKIADILNLASVTGHSNGDDEDETDNEIIEKAVKVLEKDPVGDVITKFADESILEEAMNEYVQDFVHTMYHASSGHEQKLVCQSIIYKSNGIIQESPGCGLLHNLVCIHLAYKSLAPRLTYFRAMNNVWPECSESIINLKQKKPDHFMFKEQEFTFSAVCLLIENLTPKKEELNEQLGRSRWLNKVHRYRPVVEKVISLHGEDPKLYGDHSFQSVYRAKGLWSRVLVVKLFLEHVCASEKEDKITIKHCMPLWTVLGDDTNLKKIKSLTGLEKFLKSCNKQAMKQYIGSEVKCCSCESVLEGPPITLPCGDALCAQCYDDMRVTEMQCAKCHKSLPDNWNPVRQDNNKEKLEKLDNYQKRCNSFFMDVVNQLCFADNTAPSADVVEKLLGYIFFTSRGKQQQQRTRELTVFDTGIDPNPVFRSFLLQLLMKTSEEYVQEYLNNFLQHADRYIKKDLQDQSNHYIELSLLVIQCIEDKLVQEANQVDTVRNHEALCAYAALQRAKQSINEDELTVGKLYALANARMGLAVAMKYIAMVIEKGTDQRQVDHNVRRVIDAAWTLSDESDVKWIRIFAVKYLSRCYGIEMFQKACVHPANFIHWLADRQDVNRDKVVEVSDRYIVCGEPYIKIREALTKVLLGENMEHLDQTLQELRVNGVRVEAMLQLAVHREVTCSNIHPQQQRRLKPQVQEAFTNYVAGCDIIKNKELMNSFVQNQLKPGHLISAPNQDLRVQGIQSLIVHFLSVMSHLKGDSTLLEPLLNLFNKPQACAQFFLPTMPQDDLDDVREALLAARQAVPGADNNPVFYRCPNGHPYVIGDCGRPATVGNCKDCGAVIGGEGYKLRPGNIQDQGSCGRPYVVSKCKCGADIGGSGHVLLTSNTQDAGGDNTQHGHILGRAAVRGQGPKPERTMSPAYCATIRLILHLSMYLGCRTNTAGIHAMIKPDIIQGHVIDYVWSHLVQDVDDIHVALGRSVDDVLLTMHVIINHMMKSHNEGQQVAKGIYRLSSKQGRRNWEEQFSNKFIQPVLQTLDNILKNNNQRLAQDQRLGANPLLCLLYETETSSEPEDPSVLQQIPRVWRYRTPISLQHLRQEVDARISGTRKHQKQLKVLQLFLREEHHLRALRFIPSILRLHRALFQKYQRKLDKAEASHITVSDLKREAVAGGETIQLLQDFADAWELVREHLIMYMCPTTLGGVIVPKEYCTQSINDRTPIAMLLPTVKEAGLCSYALLDFLMRKQNDFLDKYLKESHRKSTSISTVSPKEVTSAHLISYDPEHDILPLVLANCQYSFEMGKGTKIEYDFAGLERQLMDRFLFSKSRIDVGSVLQIDEMLYRTEFTNDAVFRKLAAKIPQNTLSAAVKTQVTEELKSLPDLCLTLDNLDITISFLKSTGGDDRDNLHTFMVQTLCMDEMCIRSQRARQMCEFQHCKSLWLLLSMLKAKVLVDRHQHSETIFESISKEFHEDIPVEIKGNLKDYMKTLSVEKLSQIVEVLHEFILLKVAIKENPDNEDYTDSTNYKLKDYLYAYVEEMETQDLNILNDFPADILYKHSVHTWITVYHTLHVKQTGQRRY